MDMLAPAYAATIHKSQGSEYPAVVIPVLTQHYAMLQRNLLYTVTARLGPPGTAAEGVHLGLTDVGIVVGNDVNRLRQIRLPPYRLRLSAASSSTAAAHGAD
jgi:hypothetical protein